jgi:hypothetical protein
MYFIKKLSFKCIIQDASILSAGPHDVLVGLQGQLGRGMNSLTKERQAERLHARYVSRSRGVHVGLSPALYTEDKATSRAPVAVRSVVAGAWASQRRAANPEQGSAERTTAPRHPGGWVRCTCCAG